MSNDIEVERLKAEIIELKAKVYVLERDVAALGPENARLSNAYSAARAEIARLTTKPPARRGRPRKATVGGTYEEYLVREALEEISLSMRDGGTRITEREAAIRADARIRMTAANLQAADMPGAFAGLAKQSPDEDVIYNAFRRGKRLYGLGRKRQTKK